MKEKMNISKQEKKEKLKKLTISEVKEPEVIYEVVSLHTVDQPGEFGIQFIVERM